MGNGWKRPRPVRGQVWIVVFHDKFTALWGRFNGKHADAVTRAKAQAIRLVRSAANQREPLPDFQVIDQGGEIVPTLWEEEGIYSLMRYLYEGDDDPRYRKRAQ